MDPQRLTLATAADLFCALRSPSEAVRLAVLGAIAAHPAEALALGQHAGADVVDELVHQSYQPSRYSYQRAVLTALGAYRDPRAGGVFRKLLAASTQPELVALAAGWLAGEPVGSHQDVLLALLRQDASPLHAETAARLLLRTNGLTPQQHARVAVLADDTPRLFPDQAEPWLAELAGPYALRTRAWLERCGRPAFALLRPLWSTLPEDQQIWLLQWGTQVNPLETIELLRQALESESAELTAAAHECIPRLGPAAALFEVVAD